MRLWTFQPMVAADTLLSSSVWFNRDCIKAHIKEVDKKHIHNADDPYKE